MPHFLISFDCLAINMFEVFVFPHFCKTERFTGLGKINRGLILGSI